jgi:hypothetical protein
MRKDTVLVLMITEHIGSKFALFYVKGVLGGMG